MAPKTYVSVVADPQPTHTAGDWAVKVGLGGKRMKIVSHHQLKRVAVERGKQKARAVAREHGGATLYIGKERNTTKRSKGRGRYIRYGDHQ